MCRVEREGTYISFENLDIAVVEGWCRFFSNKMGSYNRTARTNNFLFLLVIDLFVVCTNVKVVLRHGGVTHISPNYCTHQ